MRIYRQSFHLKQPLQNIAAGVLLLVFLLTPFIEAFHYHFGSEASHQLTGNLKKPGLHQFSTYNFCDICNYVQHSSYHNAAAQAALYIVYLPFVTLKGKAIALRIIPVPISSYANKGPPGYQLLATANLF